MSPADLGIFVGLRPSLESLDDLQVLQMGLGLPNPVPREDLHCTVMDSEQTMTGYTAWGEIWPRIRASSYNLEVWNWMDTRQCVVLILESEDIVSRHNRLRELYDVPSPPHPYVPHITLAYGTEQSDFHLLSPSVLVMSYPQIAFVEEYSLPYCSKVKDYIVHQMQVREHLV